MNTAGHLKARDIIPVKKEFSFIFKLTAIMILSIATALAVLYFFLDKEVGTSYRGAFQVLSTALRRLNFYIAIAVIIQLLFSSIVVYFLSLYFSHKIAGPIYRLKAVLTQYIAGEEIEAVHFRRTDFIPGVSKLFTHFFTFLGYRKKLLSEAEALTSKLEHTESHDDERQQYIQRLLEIIRELEE